jgi:hypothetical protein
MIDEIVSVFSDFRPFIGKLINRKLGKMLRTASKKLIGILGIHVSCIIHLL